MKQPATEAYDPAQFGLLARELRRRRNMTLEELSRQSGLSKGHLSRFERGEKLISVAGLMRIAKALETSVSTLIGEHVEDDVLHLVRADARKMRAAPDADGGYKFAALSSAGSSAAGPVAFIVDLPPKAQRTSQAFHSGREILFVVEGSIDVTIANRTLSLKKGDYLEFPGHLKHVLAGRDKVNQFLVVVVET